MAWQYQFNFKRQTLVQFEAQQMLNERAKWSNETTSRVNIAVKSLHWRHIHNLNEHTASFKGEIPSSVHFQKSKLFSQTEMIRKNRKELCQSFSHFLSRKTQSSLNGSVNNKGGNYTIKDETQYIQSKLKENGERNKIRRIKIWMKQWILNKLNGKSANNKVLN